MLGGKDVGRLSGSARLRSCIVPLVHIDFIDVTMQVRRPALQETHGRGAHSLRGPAPTMPVSQRPS